jgi:geranylgeranyl pyrophosphate synthase
VKITSASRPIELFRQTFRQTHALSRQIVRREISSRDGRLAEIVGYALQNQSPSDYPFVFKYAFCRKEADGRRIVALTAAIHLLQSSGFLTDDIFDQTPVRYGAPAIYVKYGVDNAILASQMLQSIALEKISVELLHRQLPNGAEVMRLLNQICRELAVGQYLDVFHSGDAELSLRKYYRVIALGVGRYFGHVARCGALLAGRRRAEVEAFTAFGYHYGMAVFITDDMLDIEKKPKEDGLMVGSDLMNRRMRLPVLFALRQAGQRDQIRLRRFLKTRGGATHREYDRIARIIVASGAMESCKRVAVRHVAASRKALRGAHDPWSAGMLDWLARTLMDAQGFGD